MIKFTPRSIEFNRNKDGSITDSITFSTMDDLMEYLLNFKEGVYYIQEDLYVFVDDDIPLFIGWIHYENNT